MVAQVCDFEVVLAAGGNPTGILCLKDSSRREEYARIAKEYMSADSSLEQFGFLEGVQHFQMSGGEFCGNAARAAALLIAKTTSKKSGWFTMSGFDGQVSYQVHDGDEVECSFPDFHFAKTEVSVLSERAQLIDLGGIVHVVLPPHVSFVNDKAAYQEAHRKVVQALGLSDRSAVGVIWQKILDGGMILIHPVVWVKDIDSFFYETACGSGTMALLIANGIDVQEVMQPSGQTIKAHIAEDHTITLRSQMQQKGGN